MIKTYKNFSVFKKNEVKNDKSPTHSLSANVGTKENPEYIDFGSAWTKDYAKGKFLSCQLSDAWVSQDGSKTRKSYVIIAEDDLNALINFAKIPTSKPEKPTGTIDYPQSDLTVEDIGF